MPSSKGKSGRQSTSLSGKYFGGTSYRADKSKSTPGLCQDLRELELMAKGGTGSS